MDKERTGMEEGRGSREGGGKNEREGKGKGRGRNGIASNKKLVTGLKQA